MLSCTSNTIIRPMLYFTDPYNSHNIMSPLLIAALQAVAAEFRPIYVSQKYHAIE